MSPNGARHHQEHMFRVYGPDELAVDGYPLAWQEIAQTVKAAAGWVCENCGHPSSRARGRVLTVHHLNGNKADCQRKNLAALCQVCHLRLQQSGAAAPNFPREQHRLFGREPGE